MLHCFDTKKDGTVKLEELKSKGWKVDEESGVEEDEDSCVYILYDCKRCYEESNSTGDGPICDQTAGTGQFAADEPCDCDCHIHCQICGNKASSDQDISCGC